MTRWIYTFGPLVLGIGLSWSVWSVMDHWFNAQPCPELRPLGRQRALGLNPEALRKAEEALKGR